MTPFEIFAALTTLAAMLSWINHRWLRLPAAIGLMILTTCCSLALAALHAVGLLRVDPLIPVLRGVDLQDTLLNGMLGALLFAGSLHLDLEDLLAQKWSILSLATGSVVLSTLIVGGGAWAVFHLVGVPIPIVYCLLFGALISPTDPIAVGAILRRAGVPHLLNVKIVGESLFNDGFGVVVFLLVRGLAMQHEATTVSHVAFLLLTEVGGGVAFGLATGWLAYRLLKAVDQYQVEILITLAIVTGGYSLAQRLHVSGPLAMVVAGLFIGNRGRSHAMSARTRERLDSFWELVDDFLNAVLFVLIGLEVATVHYSGVALLGGFLLIPLVLTARWISVGVPIALLRRLRVAVSPHAVAILTWSGLRGGISVALALSLPAGPYFSPVLTTTYIVVVFSIIVQGLTIGPFARRLVSSGSRPSAHTARAEVRGSER